MKLASYIVTYMPRGVVDGSERLQDVHTADRGKAIAQAHYRASLK